VTNRDVAAILLVRAVEETRPSAVPPAVRVDALGAAGDPDDAGVWFARRAAYLLRHALGAYRPVLTIVDVPARLAWPVLGLALLVGLLSNYLGPTSRIHVVLNPMSVLIVWNLAVYALIAARAVVLRTRRRRAPAGDDACGESALPAAGPRPPAAVTGSPGTARLPWWLRPLVPALWVRWQRSAQETGVRAADLAQVARAFWRGWIAAAAPLVAATGRRLLHLGAIGVAVGAVIGMYVRGLFFEYNVVWRSTFIRDFDHVQALLGILLAPAAALLGQGPLPADETALLMTAGGAPAARWIHLYAASTALFIFVPRTVLALSTWLRERRLARRLTPGLGAPYYRTILDQARTLRVAELAAAIEKDVRVECERFAEAVAAFVCTDLYDARIVPLIERLRREGGRIADFEEAVRAECLAFQTTLEGYLPTAQADLESALSASVARTVGRELRVEAGPRTGFVADIDRASQQATTTVGSSIGGEIADAIGLAVSAGAAVVAGTVTGGFGEAIGIAIVVTLLETTGPVGFLLGAAGGLVLAGGGWWLGRERLTGAVKRVALPATVARIALRESKLRKIVAKGRAQCHAAVRDKMRETLEPLTPTIAEQIWTRIKPLLVDTPT
jgi:hypothetical protein